MYLNEDDAGHIGVNISKLNEDTPEQAEWNRGFQDDNVLQIEFNFTDCESYVMSDILRSLRMEVNNLLDFHLTGVEYNIRDHSGVLTFSKLQDIPSDDAVSRQLSWQKPSLTIPRTIAFEGRVSCTGAFVSFFDWGYDVHKIKFAENDGMFITAIADNVFECTSDEQQSPVK